MASLSPNEAWSFVKNLISSDKDDCSRLNHILTVLKEGKSLYDSDKKHLDAKLASEIHIAQKPLVEESLAIKVQNLINSGNGDTGRLQFVLGSLAGKNTLSPQPNVSWKQASSLSQKTGDIKNSTIKKAQKRTETWNKKRIYQSKENHKQGNI